MLKFVRPRLGLLALGAIVFAMVFAAASSLSVTSDKLPQSGGVATADCDADGVAVSFTVSGGNVTEIIVSDDDCATGTITLASSTTYVYDEGATQSNASAVTWTLATPEAVASFDPGTVSFTIDPNP